MLRIVYTAVGARPADVVAEAWRIATDAFPDAEVAVTVGDMTVQASVRNPAGLTVLAWEAECIAQAGR